ncbi:MAG: electron transfer flavoprotein subunit alpha/FixB family protein [Candidatus Tectomicrobia bacterium]|uniref:Electron transfer flavoprotein subunit alpha/FixB family protein n=1 Tax=Tectimicrobiota bacterium TaxID=2528274 RepID=A0A938B366_UNCTE|nr:electron transfer flavoprotein subunit alpha/FixB family protein [Candidatus Tectomicrobia bacterium]
MAEAHGVLVLGEVSAGQLTTTTQECLAAGQALAQQAGTTLAVGLVGHELARAVQAALQAGGERVYTVDHALLAEGALELSLAAYTALCRSVAPDIILLGRTALGRDLGPRLACRLGVGLLQDCLQVELDTASGRLTATRPVYGGNVLARARCLGTPQIAALRPKTYAPLAGDPARQGEVIAVPVDLDAALARVTVVQQVRQDSAGVKLEDASIVVSGGRGLGGPEPFRELEELAGLLGAAMGASRAAVDAGWVPGTWQVGLTGKTITPDLYITVGISGASQHMAGCSGAKAIVAINKDAEANIFREARYGVVGDWQVVLPAFMEAIRALP